MKEKTWADIVRESTIPYGKHFRIPGGDDSLIYFYCPGCNEYHAIDKTWNLSGMETDNPTISPSIGVYAVKVHNKFKCHSFIRNGNIEYCGDCEHELSGQSVKMKEEI